MCCGCNSGAIVFWVGGWSILDVDLRNRLMPSAIPCEDSAIGRWDPRRCHLVDYTMDFIYFGAGLALMLLSGSFSSNAGVDVSTKFTEKFNLVTDELLDSVYQRNAYVRLRPTALQLSGEYCASKMGVTRATWSRPVSRWDGSVLHSRSAAWCPSGWEPVRMTSSSSPRGSRSLSLRSTAGAADSAPRGSDNLTAGAEQFAASQAVYDSGGDGSSSAANEQKQNITHLAYVLTNIFSVCCLALGMVVLSVCGALLVVSGVVGESNKISLDDDDEPLSAANEDEWSVTTSSSRPTSLTLSTVRPSRSSVQERTSPPRPTLSTVPEAGVLGSLNFEGTPRSRLQPLDESLLDSQAGQTVTPAAGLANPKPPRNCRTGRLRSFALGILALLSQVWIWFGLQTVFQGLCARGGLTSGCPDFWQQISYVATGHFVVSASGAFITAPGDEVLRPGKDGAFPQVGGCLCSQVASYAARSVDCWPAACMQCRAD